MSLSTNSRFVDVLSDDLGTRPASVRPGRSLRSWNLSLACGFVLLAGDCFAMLASAAVVHGCWALLWPQSAVLFNPANIPGRADLGVLFASIIMYLMVTGRYFKRLPVWTEARTIACVSFYAVLVWIALGLLTNDFGRSETVVAILSVFPIAATFVNQIAKRKLLASGLWALPVVVVGDGPDAADVEAVLMTERSLGYQFVARLGPEAAIEAAGTSSLRLLLQRYRACYLLIALHGDQQRHVIEAALRERVPFAVVPPPFACPAFTCEPAALVGYDTSLLSFWDGLSSPIARTAKATFDILVASLLLVAASPLFLIVAFVSRLDGGPTLFAHRRVGAGGRPFNCLKFRTMVVDADSVLKEVLARDPATAAVWHATRKLVDDPRVTRVGRFLRKTSLDELPQLINVLRMEMSLVGPRPIVESEIPFYGKNIAHYYATRPGLTGLWQVSGRSTTSYTRRVQLDVWYVNNWTMWHDIIVLLKTIPVVLGRHGAC